MTQTVPSPTFSARATIVALVGLAVTLMWHPFAFSLPSARDFGAALAGLLVVACGFVAGRRSREAALLLAQPALLVPLGCAEAVRLLLGALASWLPWLSSSVLLPVGALSLVSVLYFAVTGATAAWSVALMLRVADGERAYDVLWPAFADVPRMLPRALGVVAIGYGVPICFLLGFLAVPVLAFAGLLLLVPFATVWNALSATMLVDVLVGERPFFRAVAGALRTSWRRRELWFRGTLVLLGLVGVLVPLDGLHVFGDWLGGCEADSHWVDKLRGEEAVWHVSVIGSAADVACTVFVFGLRLRQILHRREPGLDA